MIVNNIEGNETIKLSFILILVITPKNINKLNPKEEIIKRTLILIPINTPIPPSNSSIPMSFVNFSKPNLVNSCCIFLDINNAIP